MKQTKRRLLSVVMALAILCTLVPSALAYGWQDYYSQSVSVASGSSTSVTAQFPNRVNIAGYDMQYYGTTSWTSSSSSVKVEQAGGNSANATISVDPGTPAGTTAVVTATAYYFEIYSGGQGGSTLNYTFNVTVTGGTGGSTTGYYTTISPSTMALNVGGSNSLSVSAIGGYYNIKNVTWSSSNPGIANVVGNMTSATVNGVSTGMATIQAYVTVQDPYNYYREYYETLSCTVYVGSASGILTLSSSTLSMSPNSTNSLTAFVGSGVDTSTQITWTTSNNSVVAIDNPVTYSGSPLTLRSLQNGQAVITAQAYINGQNYTATCTVVVGAGGQLTFYPQLTQMNPNSSQTLSVYYVNGSQIPAGATITWTSSNSSVVGFYTGTTIFNTATGNPVTLYSGAASGAADITATVSYGGQTYTGTCRITVGNALSVKATVSTGETGFSLGSTNMKTTTSVVNQIASALYSSTTGAYRTLRSVKFDTVSTTYGSLNAVVGTEYYYSSANYYGNLSSITFTPSQTYTGNAVFTFTAYDTLGASYAGTLTITVEKGTTGIDVLYTTTLGQNVTLNVQDFSTFWSKATNNQGTLRYVTFGAASSTVGRLYYTSANGQQMSVTGLGQQFYVSPSYNQNSLSGVYFMPTRTGTSYRSGTLAVPFTAYGTTSSYGTGVTSQSGTMYIVVTDGSVEDINYQAGTTGIKLDPSDFVAVYRKATSVTQLNPTVYIQFLDVPAYGSLYYNYGTGVYNNGTKLTAANIGSMMFSSQTNVGYSIANLTYVPSAGKAADTIRYAAFNANGGTLLYVGEINFGYTAKAGIKYHTNSKGVTFKATDFFNMDTGLLSVQYLNFGKPSSGTLYKNYSNGKGTPVTTSDIFSYTASGTQISSINSLTHIPAAGYTGVVTIPYSGSNITGGGNITGSITIYVVAKDFTDVPTTHWSYEYVTELTASGIVNGVTPTTFYPNSDVKYGEALKLIMLAAGYSEQAKTGSHWASGYLTRAYRDGLVTSANIDLNATVNRNTIAAIAAKALKLSPVTNITSPFVDSNDSYVLALYQAGIVEGTTNGGRTYYYGTSTIKRSEICAIICRINDYNK